MVTSKNRFICDNLLVSIVTFIVIMIANSIRPSMGCVKLHVPGILNSAQLSLLGVFKLPELTPLYSIYMLMQHHTIIVLIYVDDILVTGSDTDSVASFFQSLHTAFALRDLGPLHYFLGIEVFQSHSSFHLSQHKYSIDLLHKTDMLNSKPSSTPGRLGHHLSKNDGKPFQNATFYRSTVGALQHLTITRPDISFTVNEVCQFVAAPTLTH